jgi:hypothetical protein
MTLSTLLASIGVALMLAAFLLNVIRLMRADGYPYLTLNLIGAGLACYAASLIGFIPFIVLEGTWAMAAGGALARKAFFPPATVDRGGA